MIILRISNDDDFKIASKRMYKLARKNSDKNADELNYLVELLTEYEDEKIEKDRKIQLQIKSTFKNINSAEKSKASVCRVCEQSLKFKIADEKLKEYGEVRADFEYDLNQDDKRYHLFLCRSCFLKTLLFLRDEHRLNNDIKINAK